MALKLKSERGAVSIMLLGTFGTLILIFFLVLGTLAVGVFKNTVYVYNAAGNALKFAVYGADLDGVVSGHSDITAAEVAPYFTYAFQQITGASGAGVPGSFAGGTLPAPVMVTNLYQVGAGSELPSGTVTDQSGFVVSLSVPVLPNPIGCLDPLTVTVNRFAVAQPMPVY